MKHIVALIAFVAISFSSIQGFAQNTKQLVVRANSASQNCHSLRRQVAYLVGQLKRQQQASVCSIQQGKLRKLRVQAVLLRRSLQQICGLVDRQAVSIRLSARGYQGCGSCLVYGQCGSCPIQGAALRRSCQQNARKIRRQSKRLNQLEAECSAANRRYVSLLRQSNQS